MSEHTSQTIPTLVSLILCDQIIDDRLTGKKSAIGLFNTVWIGSLPGRLHQVSVMASLTEISGRTPLELRLVRDADNAVLMRSQGTLEAPSPLAVVDLVFSMQGIPIAAPGQYAFELHARDEILGRRRFHVLLGRPPQPGETLGGGPPRGPEIG